MKKFLAAAMAGVMLMSTPVFAQDVNVFVGDTLVEYTDQIPVIVNERTYVPIRDVFETMGFDVSWEQQSKVANISNDYYDIYLNTNNSVMYIMEPTYDSRCFKLEDQVQLINGRTMLPLREILENAGYAIEWDAETKSSIVTDTNDYKAIDAKMSELEAKMEKYDEDIKHDDTKEDGSFTQEELDYIAALVETVNSLDTEDADESDLLSIVSELKNLQVPDSLKGFNDKFIDGLKLFGADLVKMGSDVDLFNEGIEEGNQDMAFGMTVLMSTFAKMGIYFEGAVDELTSVMEERNIPQDAFTNATQSAREANVQTDVPEIDIDGMVEDTAESTEAATTAN